MDKVLVFVIGMVSAGWGDDEKEIYSGDASGDGNLITDDDDLKNELKIGNVSAIWLLFFFDLKFQKIRKNSVYVQRAPTRIKSLNSV